MNSGRIALGIGIAKVAAVPHLSTLGGAAHGVGTLMRGVVNAGGEIGEGLARGVHASPLVGRIIGSAVPVAAAAEAGRRGKRQFDNWRFQNGFYDPGYYT